MLLGGIVDSRPGAIDLRTYGGAGIVLIGSLRRSAGGGGAVTVLGGPTPKPRGSAGGGAVIVLIGSRRSSCTGAVTVVGGSVRLESTGGEVLIPLNGGVVATLALTVLGMPAGNVRVPLTGTTLTEAPGGAVDPAVFGGVEAPDASFPHGRLIAGCVRGSLVGPSPAASPERAGLSELPDVSPDVTGERSVIGGWRTLMGDFWLAGGSGDCCVSGWLFGLLKGPRGLAGKTVSRAERVSALGSIARTPASCAFGPIVLGGVRPGVECDAIEPRWLAGPLGRAPDPRLSDASPASDPRTEFRS